MNNEETNKEELPAGNAFQTESNLNETGKDTETEINSSFASAEEQAEISNEAEEQEIPEPEKESIPDIPVEVPQKDLESPAEIPSNEQASEEAEVETSSAVEAEISESTSETIAETPLVEAEANPAEETETSSAVEAEVAKNTSETIAETPVVEAETIPAEETETSSAVEAEISESTSETIAETPVIEAEANPVEETGTSSAVEAEVSESSTGDDEHEDDHDEHEGEHDSELEEHVSYDEMSREELTEKLRACVQNAAAAESRNHVIRIREAYRNAKNEEVRQKKEKYLENGGTEEDFEAPFDHTDEEFKALQDRFREERAKIRAQREKELETNLRIREGLIEELKSLVEEPGNNNKELFEKLKGIDANWRAVGRVPQLQMDEVYKTYQFHRERLFELVHINDELRELDQRKNLELKTELCEKAEALVLNDSIRESIDAYNALLKEWKDIGHVSKDQSDAIWDRFKAAGDRLYERRREYLQSRETEYADNLAKKQAIIDKTKEQIALLPYDNHSKWQEASDVFTALMEEWKKAGFASPKENERIWEEFKSLRDNFYSQKEAFYKDLRHAQNENYKVKVDLCMQAEAAKDSSDWKATADLLRSLQEKWKSSGPVARKHSDKLWKRFRTACDDFFNRRKEHFAGMSAGQDENLQKKQELIDRIQAYQHSEDGNETFETLKSFQNEWMAIGHVPMKQKDKIQKAYRTAIDAQFSKLKNLSAESRREAFRNQVHSTSGEQGGKDKLHHQRKVVQDKIKRLEGDVHTLENNIGFFANSKSKAADDMRRDIQKKIAKTREEISQLRDQLKILREEV